MRETSYSRSIRRRNRAADSISIRSNCNLEEVHHDQSRNDDDVDDNDDKDSGRNDDEAKKSSKCHMEELMVLMKFWDLVSQTKCSFLKWVGLTFLIVAGEQQQGRVNSEKNERSMLV